MAGVAVEQPGRLELVADHLVLALAPEDHPDDPTFVLSWYSLAYASGSSGGNLAFVRTPPGVPPGERILTDLPRLEPALRERLTPKTWPLRDPGQPAKTAVFARTPIQEGAVSASIRTDDLDLEVTWGELERPIVATGRVGADPVWDTSTVLMEARSWSVSINGRAIEGRPFPNGVWRTWFGHPLSSALVAIAEVFRDVEAPA